MNWIRILILTFSLLNWHGVESQLFNLQLTARLGEDPAWMRFHNTVREQLEEKGILTNFIANLFHDFFVSIKSTSFPTAVATNISQQCIDDSQFYVHNLYQNLSLWALQMHESTGQMPPGLFGSANVHADGLFDECLAVRAPGFDGQYCTVAFVTQPVDPSEILPEEDNEQLGRRNPLAIYKLLALLFGSGRVDPKVINADPNTYLWPSISFCLPSSCSADDLGQAIAQIVGGYVINNESLVTIADEQYCFKENSDPKPLDGVDITFIVVISILGLLVISATIHEAWRMYSGVGFDAKKDGQLISALHCFSSLNNGRKILSMKVSTTGDNLGCVHGLRVISTFWVVLGHAWMLSFLKTINPRAVREDAFGWKMQTILNATISVDTFFLMSGLLVSYLLLKELDRNKGRFNVGLFYLHRYLRLTIVYAIILGFVASLIVYVGTGPNWYSVTLSSNACRMIWWRQFLYINNLFPTEADLQCIGQSWYLAVDMQLFVVAPLLIYPLWRWKKYGLTWLGLITLLSHAAIFAIYAVYDLEPTIIASRFDGSPYYFDKYYDKPWTRAPPYLIGVFAGWYLHITKQSPTRLSKLVVAVGWTLATVVGLAVLYGMSPYLDPSKVPEIDPAVKMTYGPLHRTAWGMVIAWIIFACSRGYGGFVNRLLSWKGFLPLGRLTYCVYLLHYDFLNVYFSASRKLFYYTLLGQFTMCFGLIVISFGFAFITSVTIEASFLNLEKLLFLSSPPKIDKTEKEIPSPEEKMNS